MDKRSFLKRCSASPPDRSLRAGAVDKLTNWAGNIHYSTENLESVRSLERLRALVKTHPQLKVLGTRHGFNTIADSNAQFLSLEPMDQVASLDRAKRTVTVAGRLTYGQLCPYLEAQGFALDNLASLPHIWALAAPPRTVPERRTAIYRRRCRGSSW